MSDSNSPGWKRGVLIGLGVLAIILSILVFIHPGMTVATIVYIAGIILIIVGIEKIISGIFVANKSRWGTVGLGVLALIFGSIAVGYPVSTAVFVIFMLGFGLLFIGISHVIYGIGSSQGPRWARGFSIGAGALAIAFLVDTQWVEDQINDPKASTAEVDYDSGSRKEMKKERIKKTSTVFFAIVTVTALFAISLITESAESSCIHQQIIRTSYTYS